MNKGWAYFSADKKYRYLLGRRTGKSNSRLLFIMLNPSTADETQNDPTIRRCIGFAQQWSFGIMEVVNLFAFRTPHVAELRRTDDPVGPENDEMIASALTTADMVVLAWGNHGSYRNRSHEIKRLALNTAQPFHLGLNKTGEPKHPLYLPASATLTPLRTDILTHQSSR